MPSELNTLIINYYVENTYCIVQLFCSHLISLISNVLIVYNENNYVPLFVLLKSHNLLALSMTNDFLLCAQCHKPLQITFQHILTQWPEINIFEHCLLLVKNTHNIAVYSTHTTTFGVKLDFRVFLTLRTPAE